MRREEEKLIGFPIIAIRHCRAGSLTPPQRINIDSNKKEPHFKKMLFLVCECGIFRLSNNILFATWSAGS